MAAELAVFCSRPQRLRLSENSCETEKHIKHSYIVRAFIFCDNDGLSVRHDSQYNARRFIVACSSYRNRPNGRFAQVLLVR